MVVDLFHSEVVDWILVARWRMDGHMPVMEWFAHLVCIRVAVIPIELHPVVYEHGIPTFHGKQCDVRNSKKFKQEKCISKWIFQLQIVISLYSCMADKSMKENTHFSWYHTHETWLTNGTKMYECFECMFCFGLLPFDVYVYAILFIEHKWKSNQA